MSISVVVVDDDQVDRYVVKRRLAKHDAFEEVAEATTGEEFLHRYFNTSTGVSHDEVRPLLVLMDVNMPVMSGFETIEEMQRRIDAGNGTKSVVVMMFTSSNNPKDRKQAERLSSVKGYILKPLDDDGVKRILDSYTNVWPGRLSP